MSEQIFPVNTVLRFAYGTPMGLVGKIVVVAEDADTTQRGWVRVYGPTGLVDVPRTWLSQDRKPHA